MDLFVFQGFEQRKVSKVSGVQQCSRSGLARRRQRTCKCQATKGFRLPFHPHNIFSDQLFLEPFDSEHRRDRHQSPWYVNIDPFRAIGIVSAKKEKIWLTKFTVGRQGQEPKPDARAAHSEARAEYLRRRVR